MFPIYIFVTVDNIGLLGIMERVDDYHLFKELVNSQKSGYELLFGTGEVHSYINNNFILEI